MDTPNYGSTVSLRQAATIGRVLDMFLPAVSDRLDVQISTAHMRHGGGDCPGWWTLVVDLGPETGALPVDGSLVDALEEQTGRSVQVMVHGYGSARINGRIHTPLRCVPVGVHEYADGELVWKAGGGRGPQTPSGARW